MSDTVGSESVSTEADSAAIGTFRALDADVASTPRSSEVSRGLIPSQPPRYQSRWLWRQPGTPAPTARTGLVEVLEAGTPVDILALVPHHLDGHVCRLRVVVGCYVPVQREQRVYRGASAQ